jgi:hypothetical protein
LWLKKYTRKPLHHFDPTKTFQSLLGLGLKVCPTLSKTTGPEQFKEPPDRLRKLINTQMYFSGASNHWKPKQVFIAKEDWDPNINELLCELLASTFS